MRQDITHIISGWPFHPEGAVRKISGDDGREKVQMRVRIGTFHGVLQFECDGRSDGGRPHGREFALDHYEAILPQRTDESFKLNHAECEELFEESAMTYERYVILLQLSDWDRVIRDTMRNMKLFRFVHKYAEKEDDRDRLERWWPYILRIYHSARASKLLDEGSIEAALNEVHDALLEIGATSQVGDTVHELERARSLKALDELKQKLLDRLPPSSLERLEREKERAVEDQDYERAAEIRDRIRKLRKSDDSQAD